MPLVPLALAVAVAVASAAPSDVDAPVPTAWDSTPAVYTGVPASPPEPQPEPETTPSAATSLPPEPGCAPCRPHRCPRTAMECEAGVGLAVDPCGCCGGGVCGLAEGAGCYSAQMDLSLRALGVCGDNMDCVPRTDLGPAVEEEALCVCRERGQVCGSDNTTYASTCQMKAARPPPASGGGDDEAPANKVWLKHRGPCRSVPWIVSPPSPVRYAAGSPVSLECEAKGFPTPAASWERLGPDGIAAPLPGDDAAVVVMVRGGPEPFMVTSWLQIMALREADEGSYFCVATNSEGAARVATVVAVDSSPPPPPPPTPGRN